MHLMIDFETLDTRPTATVLSLGCVLFDESGIIDTKYLKYSLQDQLDSGRSVSSQTLGWWMQQDGHARQVFETNKEEVSAFRTHVLLLNWLEANGVERNQLRVWGNGASFDIPILEDLSKDYPPLYNFWNIMCFRTFDKLTGCKKLAKLEGTQHHALDDARYQAQCLINYWKQQNAG